MKKILAIVLTLCLVLALCACGQKAEAPAAPADSAPAPAAADEKPAEDKVFEIGVILKSADDPWCAWTVKEIELAAAKDYPQFNVEVIDSDFDQAKSVAAMETMITKGKDAIIIEPIDQTGISYMVDNAFEAGIPVISISNPIDSEHTYNIVADSYTEGHLEGETLCAMLPDECCVVELQGQLGMTIATERHQGILDAIEESGKNITMLDSQTGEWMKDKSMSIMEDWIQVYGDKIAAVFSANDYMALGAMEALKAAGMVDNVIIAGVDCLPEACTAIKDGTYTFTVINDAPLCAKMALETAYKLVNGEEVDHNQVVGSSICDASNVDEWIEIHKASGNL